MYLNTHSYFSFRYGVMSPQDLLGEAQRAGVSAMVMSDINSTAGSLIFARLAPKYGIRPVLGVDCRHGAQQQFVAIAKDNQGFQEINEYLSPLLHRKEKIPTQAPAFKRAFVIYPFQSATPDTLRADEYIGVAVRDLLKVPFSKVKHLKDKMVIMQTVSFRHQSDFNVHRLLRAIDNNTLLSKLEKSEEGHLWDRFYIEKDLLAAYQDYPQMIQNTKMILDQCSIHFEFGNDYAHKNISTYNKTLSEDYQHIRRLCLEGLRYRYPQPNIGLFRRLALELDIIRKKEFVSYFLVNWDLVSYARSQNFFYVGRGSGANSVVAYILRITDVDPIELDLYFERFINLYRTNPPDFDIDFSWRDRDEIVKYMFDKYGYDRVCLIATYNTFKYKAVVRELGKVFGLPTYEIDKLARADVNKSDEITRLIIKYASKMEEIPSHLSVHASGVVISEKPIHYYTTTSLPPKGFPITHFDMVVAEDAGLYKFDILSQRGLEKIKDAVQIVAQNHPEDPPIDIHNTRPFFEDEKVKVLLRNGQAIGCFYVESPAMRMLLTKLRADNYLGLVAASSVIRPGVAKSGMMRQYILRFRKPEKRKEAHPVLADLMPETFGVMVYQEDVIKVAHYFAGLSLGEADMLRRGMSGKFRSREEFQKVKEKFFSNCLAAGHTHALTAEIWRQVESFAGYAFAKGHSASYAVESYQSLYLKAHYPLEFMVAVLNNGGGFYSRELYIHEARMHGAIIEPPCINTTSMETTIKGQTIFLGFHIMKDTESQAINHLLSRRAELGCFTSIEQVVSEVGFGLEQLKLFIRIGALRSIETNKKKLLWQAYFLLSGQQKKKYMYTLFEVNTNRFQLPSLAYDHREDAFDQMEILGFPMQSPFELLKDQFPGMVFAEDLAMHNRKHVSMLGYMITVKRTITTNGKSMFFGTFVDAKGYFIDTVHFPPVAGKYPFRGKGIYFIKGKVVEEFEFFSLEVIAMYRADYINMEDIDAGASLEEVGA